MTYIKKKNLSFSFLFEQQQISTSKFNTLLYMGTNRNLGTMSFFILAALDLHTGDFGCM